MFYKIRVAKTAGFCFGVKRAIDIVFEIINTSAGEVRTLGPLIHNDQVLGILRHRGVHALSEGENPEGKKIVIRAHGVAPDERRKLREQGAVICDATCPKVAQVQAIVKKYSSEGYVIVIIGDRGHAEVDGLLGYARNKGIVLADPEEARTLDNVGEKICVVAQTTQYRDVFNKTVEVLKERFSECRVFDTICDATSERQDETLRLARQSDIVIVVGGRHSANTRRLVNIARQECQAFHVQTADDISWDMVKDGVNIGITAGASTPSWLIRQVVERVKDLMWRQTNPILRFLHVFLAYMLKLNVLFGAGIGFLSLGMAKLLSIPVKPVWMMMAFWFAFTSLALDDILDPLGKLTELASRVTPSPFHVRRVAWMAGLILFALVVLWSARQIGEEAFGFVLASGLFCLIYSHTGLFRMFGVRYRTCRRLSDCVLIRDSLMSLMTAGIVVALPAIAEKTFRPALPFYLLFVAVLVWVRHVILDIRDIQSDLIIGRRSLPLSIGKDRLKRVLIWIWPAWVLLPVIPVLLGWMPANSLVMLVIPFYFTGFALLYHQRLMFLSLTSDLVVDASLFVGGILPFLL